LSSGVTKPLAQTLFWISCLLSVVSFYTTREGMSLYLSPWFSFLAALGVQLALVIVAWLFGAAPREGRRSVLVGVYVITAVISIAFSYVSLNTWFGERERPVMAQRELYDELNGVASRTEPILADAVANGRRYTLALEEMAAAEKQHGHISRSRDAEPYLNVIREAVAKEAQSVAGAYKEGSGEGVRYTAFSRHAQLTRQATEAIESSWQAIARAKADLKPGMATDAQLRQFHMAYDPIPWNQVEELLGRRNLERPGLPAYARFAERSGSGQEDLMRSFEELLTKPSARNVFSVALAAFIDLIVFLLAFAAGPYLHGEPDQRWYAAGAALDSHDQQVFARDLLRKMRPGRQGLPRVDAEGLTDGERQLCLLLVNHGQAALQEEQDGSAYYLIEAETHRRLAESIATPSLPFRAAAAAAAK
jgi:hypothetical protein